MLWTGWGCCPCSPRASIWATKRRQVVRDGLYTYHNHLRVEAAAVGCRYEIVDSLYHCIAFNPLEISNLQCFTQQIKGMNTIFFFHCNNTKQLMNPFLEEHCRLKVMCHWHRGRHCMWYIKISQWKDPYRYYILSGPVKAYRLKSLTMFLKSPPLDHGFSSHSATKNAH